MWWFGGAWRRWVDLVGLLATGAGIVTFALTEHIRWAWLAIGGLVLLVVSLAWELRQTQRHQSVSSSPAVIRAHIDRAIADGNAILELRASSYQWHEWQEWWQATEGMLREQAGLEAAYGFQKAIPRADPGEAVTAAERTESQVVYLEGLRRKQ